MPQGWIIDFLFFKNKKMNFSKENIVFENCDTFYKNVSQLKEDWGAQQNGQ